MSRSATLRRLGAAAATLSLLAGTALAAGPAAAQDTGGDETSGLHWGIKQSWRNYMNAFGGTITPSGGAVLDPDPELPAPKPYVWPEEASTFDPATGTGTVEFGGAVSFSMPAHFIWDFTFAEPAVTFEGDGTGTLSGTVSYAFYGTRDNPEQVQEPTEVVFADLTFEGAPAAEGGTVAATISSAVLTEEGAAAFAGFYEPGAELDAGALTFAVPDSEPPPQGEPAVTVTPSKGLDPDGAEVTIKGTNFAHDGNDGKGYRLRVGPGLDGLKDPGAGGAYLLDREIPVADDGTWTVTTTVKAAYTGTDGVSRTAKDTPFSVHTFAWESRDTTWDTTTPLAFASTPDVPGPGDGDGNGDGDKDDPAPSCVLTPDDAAKGDLVWGLKKSFRNYVGVGIGGARGNSITAGDGAVITDIDEVVRDGTPNPAGVPTGAYRFAFGSADYRSADEFTVSYRGTVTFAYPSHFFTFVLGDPEVVVEGGTGTLRADVELRAEEGAPSESVNLPGVALAELDLAGAEVRDEGGALAIEDIAATLASDEAFAGFYTAGTELDPVSLTLGAECAQLPGGNGGNTGGIGAGGGSGNNLVPSVQFRPQAGANGLAQTGMGAWPVYAGLSLLVGGVALTLLARRRAGASDT
ncbi:hypothetical protein BAY61_11865 [Prauserella marina]|uniref:Htaa protein n=1 Tax=Prauserella marina TaxID=530584 RepID=A0A222VNS7_9PSEU|nr:HtaA domain-containing protein [Prauserella marina]ASR35576.1 hypothetical protein BAY61_11865 [Prauserella marina]PWV84570.1 Htaa protein [Prauserella marina]SDC18917.1 Htaa protein [Prauserella marina]